MNDIIQHLLTGKDNKTHDLGRWTWLISLIAVIAVALWEVIHTNQVSIRELAEALGIVSAAGGASVAMKQGSEPQ